MCLRTLHDRVKDLGLGAMYEKHARCHFRDLFDNASADWASTEMPQKVVDLKGFASAGVFPEEIIGHYRETMTREDDRRALESLAPTMRAYRDAGFWPPLPDDVQAAIDAMPPRLEPSAP